jgi:hypothetical protein
MRLLLLMMLVVTQGWAKTQTWSSFLSGYAPQLNGRTWPQVPLVTYTNISNTWMNPKIPHESPTVKLSHSENSEFTTIVLQLADGRTFETNCNFSYASEVVYSGDFNKDTIPDVLVIKNNGGCVIAGQNCTGIFAFSEGKNYRFARISSMGLGPHSLVLDPTTKDFRLMQTSLCGAYCLDGKPHNFWVHRFYKWNGKSFESAPNLPPIWIQYLNRTNHEPTKLLTPELKAKAWAKNSESEDITE